MNMSYLRWLANVHYGKLMRSRNAIIDTIEAFRRHREQKTLAHVAAVERREKFWADFAENLRLLRNGSWTELTNAPNSNTQRLNHMRNIHKAAHESNVEPEYLCTATELQQLSHENAQFLKRSSSFRTGDHSCSSLPSFKPLESIKKLREIMQALSQQSTRAAKEETLCEDAAPTAIEPCLPEEPVADAVKPLQPNYTEFSLVPYQESALILAVPPKKSLVTLTKNADKRPLKMPTSMPLLSQDLFRFAHSEVAKKYLKWARRQHLRSEEERKEQKRQHKAQKAVTKQTLQKKRGKPLLYACSPCRKKGKKKNVSKAILQGAEKYSEDC